TSHPTLHPWICSPASPAPSCGTRCQTRQKSPFGVIIAEREPGQMPGRGVVTLPREGRHILESVATRCAPGDLVALGCLPGFLRRPDLGPKRNHNEIVAKAAVRGAVSPTLATDARAGGDVTYGRFENVPRNSSHRYHGPQESRGRRGPIRVSNTHLCSQKV